MNVFCKVEGMGRGSSDGPGLSDMFAILGLARVPYRPDSATYGLSFADLCYKNGQDANLTKQ